MISLKLKIKTYKKQDLLFGARDFFGIKPMYYYLNDNETISSNTIINLDSKNAKIN